METEENVCEFRLDEQIGNMVLGTYTVDRFSGLGKLLWLRTGKRVKASVVDWQHASAAKATVTSWKRMRATHIVMVANNWYRICNPNLCFDGSCF
jgi:hypothetical protein